MLNENQCKVGTEVLCSMPDGREFLGVIDKYPAVLRNPDSGELVAKPGRVRVWLGTSRGWISPKLENVRRANPEIPMMVAVYGSLRKGGHNFHYIGRYLDSGEAKYMGTFQTADPFLMEDKGSFPSIHGSATEQELALAGRITVEVYEVGSLDMLKRLDQLEGHPRWYRRQEVRIADLPADLKFRRPVQAYVMPERPNLSKLVDGGDWIQWNAENGNRAGIDFEQTWEALRRQEDEAGKPTAETDPSWQGCSACGAGPNEECKCVRTPALADGAIEADGHGYAVANEENQIVS